MQSYSKAPSNIALSPYAFNFKRLCGEYMWSHLQPFKYKNTKYYVDLKQDGDTREGTKVRERCDL